MTATRLLAMKQLLGASDEEARVLYATVRNSSIGEPAKAELLKKMYDHIQARVKTEEPKKGKK